MSKDTYKYFEALDLIAGDIIDKGPITINENKLLKLRKKASRSDDWSEYDEELDKVLDRHFNLLGQDEDGDDKYELKEKEVNND